LPIAPARGPQIVDGSIASDGQQPRSDGSLLRIAALRAIPDAQKGLLHQVFRDSHVAHYAQNQRVHDASVPIVAFGHGLRIPSLQAFDEITVVTNDTDGEP